MDFNELIASFAERHGIADLAAEDYAAALDIDGIVVTLVAAGDALSASADVGEPPAEGRADFAELLLEASLDAIRFRGFRGRRPARRRRKPVLRRRLRSGRIVATKRSQLRLLRRRSATNDAS